MPDDNQPNEAAKTKPTQETIMEELKTDERLKPFFEQYQPASVERFIKDFAWQKVEWWQNGELHIQMNEREDMQWINKANEHLSIIQQKKLFDVQCQWRAESIELDGVEVTYDFLVWEQNVMFCPFIEPVTEKDVELYQSFLASTNFKTIELPFLSNWQDYDDLKEAYQSDNEQSNFYEWYDFHNVHTGASAYLLLPDIRGEKEEFYRDKCREANAEQIEKIDAAIRSGDQRPFLNMHDKEMVADFVKKYQDKQTLAYYKAYKRFRRTYEKDGDITEIITLLLESEEPVPIEAHYDFREALRAAERRFIATKISEFLPYAFNEYELNVSMNFGPSAQVLSEVENYKKIKAVYVDGILQGRKFMGEPENLDF